ncbi:E3 ubiquitin-protein ligase XB3-like [Ananas comosus]|uniref:E3 ubiquitin-protein ligase XB3-like n=1 Tax=Ananas comosus TaxID=4615 RepID=A0A6P5G8A9_ANACO|nr:E3 ubiquitin-protein ligase XB3-like [Ananas comosus]
MRSSVASALTKHAPLKSETGHQMCTYCMLSLCCHSKPNPVTSHLSAPSCPFCRILTTQLVVANVKNNAEGDKNLRARISKRTRKLNEGSSSLKGLSSAISLFGRINGRGKLKVDDSGCSVTDKL